MYVPISHTQNLLSYTRPGAGAAIHRGGGSLDSKEQQRVAKALRKALGEDVEISSPPPLLRSELKVGLSLRALRRFPTACTVCTTIPHVSTISETGAPQTHFSAPLLYIKFESRRAEVGTCLTPVSRVVPADMLLLCTTQQSKPLHTPDTVVLTMALHIIWT